METRASKRSRIADSGVSGSPNFDDEQVEISQITVDSSTRYEINDTQSSTLEKLQNFIFLCLGDHNSENYFSDDNVVVDYDSNEESEDCYRSGMKKRTTTTMISWKKRIIIGQMSVLS